mmetsp:Transcript_70333/g.209643  ORF Transcript_70333/g.209643 Transcript_70333/m.209643 type:complete len:328 (+) Transcript_70333:1-984(+)
MPMCLEGKCMHLPVQVRPPPSLLLRPLCPLVRRCCFCRRSSSRGRRKCVGERTRDDHDERSRLRRREALRGVLLAVQHMGEQEYSHSLQSFRHTGRDRADPGQQVEEGCGVHEVPNGEAAEKEHGGLQGGSRRLRRFQDFVQMRQSVDALPGAHDQARRQALHATVDLGRHLAAAHGDQLAHDVSERVEKGPHHDHAGPNEHLAAIAPRTQASKRQAKEDKQHGGPLRRVEDALKEEPRQQGAPDGDGGVHHCEDGAAGQHVARVVHVLRHSADQRDGRAAVQREGTPTPPWRGLADREEARGRLPEVVGQHVELAGGVAQPRKPHG